jgi:integrase
VPRFLADCRAQEVAAHTLDRYQWALDHVCAGLGRKRLRDLTRADVRTFLLSKERQEGAEREGTLGRSTVRQLRAVLSGLLALALEDEVIANNPCVGAMRRRRTRAARKAIRATAGTEVKAMTREQRNSFLATAATHEPDAYPAFVVMALAGLRLNEALGLKWPAVDFDAAKIRVHEQLINDSTKSGAERLVDVAAPLASALFDLLAQRRTASFATGEPLSPFVVFPWLSVTPTKLGHERAKKRISRAMEKTLKRAGLPAHFTPHSLRHTFCSLLIAQGESPVYVQQQAGHASVQMTVGVYGSWFAMESPGAMDRLAAGVPAAPVAKEAATGNRAVRVGGEVIAATGTYGDATTGCPSSCR